ncbi:CHASE3 domain-containing protein [Kribbella monticola]|uniref:CHASE3 domain-containing protein n=1 Tax=Kribbella monticola TaxID=2185285 RepID=UPI0013008746|nr:CHASE3 domain-containing protein [Kribbella monticola]
MVILLLVLLVISAGGSAISRFRVAGAQRDLETRLIPVQTATDELAKAFVDQETGQRGYLLTGSADFLQPYYAGVTAANVALTQIRRMLAGEDQALRALTAVEEAGQDWRLKAAEPEISARRAGAIPASRLDAIAADGKARFDLLRTRLNKLTAEVTGLVTRQLDRIAASQLVANVVNAAAVLLALIVSLLSIPLARRHITLPLELLVLQVQAVADGSRDSPITPGGPTEFNELARAVEKMRASLLDSSEELMRAQQTIAVNDERARMAVDLQEQTIQQVFALGLMLSSAAARDPHRAQTFLPFIEETDRIIREVRSLIFDLGGPRAGNSREQLDRPIQDT